MNPIEALTRKIQDLETLYADALANNASVSELTELWNKIKLFQRRIALHECMQTIEFE